MRDFLCASVIGRDDELAKLAGALHDAAESRGSAMFLVGEAGIGKSRLVREAIGTAQDLRLQVLVGRATQSSGTVAFRPLSEALFSYFRDQDLPGAPELEPFRGSLARLLPQWRQAEICNADDSVVMLAEAILRLLRVVARNRGCLLALEDLHWADPETLSIVEYVSENLASERVMLLCSVRSETGSALDLVDALVARRTVAVANLTRLTPADTAAMGRACLSVPELPDQVGALLEANADGLPFFVEELLAGAVDAGALEPRDEGWTVRGQVDLQVPRTFVDSVDRRLAGLGDSAQILIAAAVLGRRFDWAVLCEVTATSRDVVLGALRAGVDAQLLAPEPPAPGSMEFRHTLTRDAVVGRLLAVERGEIARRALEAILAAHPCHLGHGGDGQCWVRASFTCIPLGRIGQSRAEARWPTSADRRTCGRLRCRGAGCDALGVPPSRAPVGDRHKVGPPLVEVDPMTSSTSMNAAGRAVPGVHSSTYVRPVDPSRQG